jgi:hypothetical protein
MPPNSPAEVNATVIQKQQFLDNHVITLHRVSSGFESSDQAQSPERYANYSECARGFDKYSSRWEKTVGCPASLIQALV